jgi:dihydrofolate reductase
VHSADRSPYETAQTRFHEEPCWVNRGFVASLVYSPGGDIGVTGSISVVHALMHTDLVDEYRLFVYPVLTSRGRNLVPDGLSMQGLTLKESRAFRSGVVLLTYSRS